jgi:hypothetical protein
MVFTTFRRSDLDCHKFSFFITRPRSRMSYTHKILVSILILLSGDIQSNPGPSSNVSSLNMCILNIRSLTNPLYYTAISDLAQTHKIHVFLLTETWISPATTFAKLFDAIPHEFSFISTPRPVSGSSSCSIMGGGTGFFFREPCKLLSSPSATFKSFELSTLAIKLPRTNLAL